VGTFIERNFLQFVFEVPGIILAQFGVAAALAIRLMKSTVDSIGQRYEIVARTSGCSVWKAFFKVTLPVAKNGVIAAGILAWARAVGEYGATVTLAGATQMGFFPRAFAQLELKPFVKPIRVVFISVPSSFSVILPPLLGEL